MAESPDGRADELAALRGAGGGAVPTQRDAVTVVGPDAGTYLQGQLSQDVAGLAVGAGAWTFVLSPQGKVDAWGRVSRTADAAFVLDVDPGHGPALRDRLARFLLRTEAELAAATWPMVAVRGRAGIAAPAGVLAADPAWPGTTGVDLLGPGAEVPADLAVCSLAALERLRIEAGVPRMGAEVNDRTIPAEVGVVERSVSFTKGCYTGQELVARIDSRGGNVPRHLRIVEGPEDAEPAVGAEVVVDGAVVGALTSVAPAVVGEPLRALALVGRAVVPPAPAVVAGVEVLVRAVPGS